MASKPGGALSHHMKIEVWWLTAVILTLRSQREGQDNCYKFKANLGYMVSSGPARDTEQDPVQITKQSKIKPHHWNLDKLTYRFRSSATAIGYSTSTLFLFVRTCFMSVLLAHVCRLLVYVDYIHA